MADNVLYYGDNLDVLRRHVADESVDLVYLDPPFNSNADYNVLFAEKGGEKAHSQIKAFEDTWHWDTEAAANFEDAVQNGGPAVASCMSALKTLLGTSDMLAYLSMMAPHLVELHKVLRLEGSIYLHCDPTASHYLKILMDAVFGPENFGSEIIWRRTGSHNSSKRFGPIHDVILFYRRSRLAPFYRVFRPYLKGHVDSYFKKQDEQGRKYWTNALTGKGTRNGESGQPWRRYNPTPVGRHWAIPGVIAEELGLDPELSTQEKLEALDAAGFVFHPQGDSEAMPTYRQYLDRSPGMPIGDIWCYQPHTRGMLYANDDGIDEDVRWLVAQGDAERLGYPTQKPLGLLERIILSSSRPGDTVLDPFCGCGTAIVGAQKLGRKWLGIDITHLAIKLIKGRLADAFGTRITSEFKVVGEPTDLESAKALAEQDKYQFQYWALGLAHPQARPEASQQKKGADKGIDGRMSFIDSGEVKTILFSVKGGHVNVAQIRDFRGVLERDNAAIGIFVCIEEVTGPMRKEAADAGFYTTRLAGASRYPRLQILTIEGLLNGDTVEIPLQAEIKTFKAAKKVKQKTQKQTDLPFTQP